MNEEELEPNMQFVEPFDNFCSFAKAAGYIEDWIRTKKHNATDFTNDLPAILERGKLVRKVLVHIRKQNPEIPTHLKDDVEIESEVKNVSKLIYTKDLYETEADYLYYFLMNLVECCSVRPEVPLVVIRIAWNHLKSLIDDEKIIINKEQQKFAIERLDKIRADIVHEVYKHMQLQALVAPDFFEKLIEAHIENSRLAEASTLIIKFNLVQKFDLMELIIGLVKSGKTSTAKLFLETQPALREKVIRRLSTPEDSKTAAELVKDYKLDPEAFPELQSILCKSSSNYFIGRAFRHPSNADYLPLAKIEDLFTGNTLMLTELT